MNFFHSASIKAKLLIAFGAVLLISLTVSGIAIKSLSGGIDTAEQLQNRIEGSYARISAASNGFEAANTALLAYLTPDNQTPERMKQVEIAIDDMVTVVNRLQGMEAETSKQVQALKDNALKISKLYNENIVSLIKQHRPYGALEVYLYDIAPILTDVSHNVDYILSYRLSNIKQYAEELVQTTSLTIVIVLTIIQIVSSMAIALVIASYIQVNIHKQVENLKALESGDFTLKFSNSAGDEFGTLNETMRNMTDKLRATLVNVINLSHDINHSMEHVEESSNNICTSMSSASSQAVTVAAAADEMVATTSNIAKNCSDAAKSSNDSSQLTKEGMDIVNASQKAIMHQYEQMKANAAAIHTLVEQAQTIGSIVGTIDEIASQTNLLALNAAIEAARAGEAGRGFAVVADEVRALATRTTASTTEIRGMVDRIQAQTTHATEAMQSNLDSMSTVAADSTNVQETLAAVLKYVEEVNTQITQIATAAEQQSAASTEISNNMQNITHSTAEVNTMAQDSREISVGTNQSLEELLTELKFFKIQ